MKLSIYSQSGKKSTKEVEVPDTIFGAKINESLLAQYVYTYLSNQREAVAHSKDRSQVSGGGRKPWKQKGTGRARVGSNRSPIWVKGGITFGPTSARNWKKIMPKKMKIAAMCSAFSKINKAEAVKIIDAISFDDKALTKQAAQVLTDMKLEKKTLIVTKQKDAKVLKAFSNLPKTSVVQVGELNAYDLFTNNNVVICADALDYLNHWA